MSFNVNEVRLGGRLTRDPELRFTSNQTPVVQVGFAVNRRVKRGEEWVEEPVFVDVTMFGKRAEVVHRNLRKGDQAYFSGELKLDQWDDKNGGGKRSMLKVIANEFQFVGSKRETAPASDAAGTDDTPF